MAPRPRTGPTAGRRRLVLATATVVVAAVALTAACSVGGGTSSVTVGVDGGSDGVVLHSGALIEVNPGASVTIEHGGVGGGNAPVTHAFVGGAERGLPPLFTPAQGGLVPNAAVWGQCRGGDVTAATATCPIPPAEGPAAWDGQAYWSTGALLPGESREVPLAENLAAGSYALVCALHPQLRVEVVVADDEAAEPPGEPVRAERAVAEAEQQARGLPPGEVVAGAVVEGAYVGRFVPATVTIAAGESVTWTAGGRAPVDVVFNGGDLDLTHTDAADALPAGDAESWDGDGLLRSGYLSSDPSAGATAQSWTATFTQPGTYPYASRFGAELTGTVIVEEK